MGEGGWVVRHMLKGYRRSLCVLAVFFVTNIALQLTAPQLLSRFVDSTQEGAGYALVGALIAGYLILTLLGLAARVGEQYFSETLGWRMTNDFQRLVLERF